MFISLPGSPNVLLCVCIADQRGAKPKVVILGGGFGGLYTALRLAELSKPSKFASPVFDITLVEK